MPEWNPMDSKSGHIVELVYVKTFYAYYKSSFFASHPDYIAHISFRGRLGLQFT